MQPSALKEPINITLAVGGIWHDLVSVYDEMEKLLSLEKAFKNKKLIYTTCVSTIQQTGIEHPL
jgi:hypothetical protein